MPSSDPTLDLPIAIIHAVDAGCRWRDSSGQEVSIYRCVQGLLGRTVPAEDLERELAALLKTGLLAQPCPPHPWYEPGETANQVRATVERETGIRVRRVERQRPAWLNRGSL